MTLMRESVKPEMIHIIGADEEVIEINVDLEDPQYDDADWETFELSRELYHALTAQVQIGMI